MAIVQSQVRQELPKLGQIKWFKSIKQTVQEFMADDAMGMAAEMAYHFLFALFPALLMIFALLGVVQNLTPGSQFQERLLTYMQEALPPQAYEALQPIIQTTLERASGAGFILGTGLILAIWSASSGVQSLMKGFNVAYDVVETRNFIKKKLVAIALTLGMAVFLILALALLVFGQQIGQAIAESVGLGAVFTTAWNIGRWVLMGVLLVVGLAVLYYFAPNVNQKFIWISPGAIVATILWFLATIGFTFYVNNFANYGSYGIVGGVIVLIFWMYITSIVLLIGAEMNGVLGQKHDPAMAQDERQTATGSGARPVVGAGGRLVGAGANELKGAPSQDEDATNETPGKSRRSARPGSHRGPGQDEPTNTPRWRNKMGRQDPERVAAGRREEEKKNGKQSSGSQNGDAAAALAAARSGPKSGREALDERRNQAPAKNFIWAMLHDGGHALAIHGTRQALGAAWRTVFDQSPPPQVKQRKEEREKREKKRTK